MVIQSLNKHSPSPSCTGAWHLRVKIKSVGGGVMGRSSHPASRGSAAAAQRMSVKIAV